MLGAAAEFKRAQTEVCATGGAVAEVGGAEIVVESAEVKGTQVETCATEIGIWHCLRSLVRCWHCVAGFGLWRIGCPFCVSCEWVRLDLVRGSDDKIGNATPWVFCVRDTFHWELQSFYDRR